MYCGNCGAELSDGSKFCHKCGASIEEGDIHANKRLDLKKKALLISMILLIGAALVLLQILRCENKERDRIKNKIS